MADQKLDNNFPATHRKPATVRKAISSLVHFDYFLL